VIPPSSADAEFFAQRGFELQIEARYLFAEHVAQGEHGRASFFVDGRLYYCVQVLGGGRVIAHDYAYGETVDEALAAARRRYGSEQM
jgi:hypothetical protein